MKKTNEVIGLPVISINEAKEIGVLKTIVINAETNSVSAFVLDDGKWYLEAKLLPISEISGIGESAVTVVNSNVAVKATSAPHLESLLDNDVKIIGTKVLSNKGQVHGTVVEIGFNETDGKIEEITIEETNGHNNIIPATQVYSFGKAVTIITNEQVPQPQIHEDNSLDTNSSKKFDKKIVGKKANHRIQTDNGTIIIDAGGEVTEETIQKAKLAGKLSELSMSVS